MRNPGLVPEPAEAARFLASQTLVTEWFARVDAHDVDGALELYADDAVFLNAHGKAAIRDAMVRGTASMAGKRSRHVIANFRAEALDADTMLAEYTATAFTLEGPGPYAARSVFDQTQRHRRQPDGTFRIVEHQIAGFTPPA